MDKNPLDVIIPVFIVFQSSNYTFFWKILNGSLFFFYFIFEVNSMSGHADDLFLELTPQCHGLLFRAS